MLSRVKLFQYNRLSIAVPYFLPKYKDYPVDYTKSFMRGKWI